MQQEKRHNDLHFAVNRTEHKEFRRRLRNHGTSAEAILWTKLKNRNLDGIKFRRQFSIETYILDFYSPELRLCIEIDGSHHFTPEGHKYDLQRTEYLWRLHGVRVLRFENKDVYFHLEGVLTEIRNAIIECRSGVCTFTKGRILY